MSAVQWPDHLLTLDEWDALGEDDTLRRAELAEGVLQISPSPAFGHQRAMFLLAQQLEAALNGLPAITVCALDVVLDPAYPPTVRQPDVAVIPEGVAVGSQQRLFAADVELAVEITSPGSRRIDRIMKLADYADAGIPHYWILDLDGRVSLDTFGLVDGRYVALLQAATGRVHLEQPFAVELDLDALAP